MTPTRFLWAAAGLGLFQFILATTVRNGTGDEYHERTEIGFSFSPWCVKEEWARRQADGTVQPGSRTTVEPLSWSWLCLLPSVVLVDRRLVRGKATPPEVPKT